MGEYYMDDNGKVYKKEDLPNLWGLITDENSNCGTYKDLGKRRILWQDRLQTTKSTYDYPELNDFDTRPALVPRKIGEYAYGIKDDAFKITENDYYKIAGILEKELSELIIYLAKIEKSEFGNYIFHPFNIFVPWNSTFLLSVDKNRIVALPNLDIYKYTIKYHIDKDLNFKFDTFPCKNVSDMEQYLITLANMIDNIYFTLDNQNRENESRKFVYEDFRENQII